jgi:hypothetical protein
MSVILVILGAYLALGFAFALAFVSVGIGRIDHSARSGPIGFRVLTIPGSMALWPLVALRWLRGREARQWPRENTRAMRLLRRAHLAVWLVLGPALLAGLVLAMALRPDIAPGAGP